MSILFCVMQWTKYRLVTRCEISLLSSTVPTVEPADDFHLQVGIPCRVHKQGGLYRIIQYRPLNGLKTATMSLCPCGYALWLRLHHYIKPASGPKEHNSSQSRTAMLLIVRKVTSLILRQSLVVDTNVIHYAVEIVLAGREGLTTNHKSSW